MSEQESVFYYTVWRGFTPVVLTPEGFRVRDSGQIRGAYRFASETEAEQVADQLGCDVCRSYGPLEIPKLSKPWPTKHPHK